MPAFSVPCVSKIDVGKCYVPPFLTLKLLPQSNPGSRHLRLRRVRRRVPDASLPHAGRHLLVCPILHPHHCRLLHHTTWRPSGPLQCDRQEPHGEPCYHRPEHQELQQRPRYQIQKAGHPNAGDCSLILLHLSSSIQSTYIMDHNFSTRDNNVIRYRRVLYTFIFL